MDELAQKDCTYRPSTDAETENVAIIISERGADGNRVLWQLVGSDMCWDGIEQRGTWHETDGGYLWILVVWTLDPVASATMLLTETCTL